MPRYRAESALAEFEQQPSAGLRHEVIGDPRGTWDPDRILQLLSNLLGNALQHGDPGVPIVLRIDGRDRDVVHVEIENGGVLPDNVRDDLFAPFVRANAGGGGAGLGLYIVHHIARAHGGEVAAESGGGRTVFRARLPRHHPSTSGAGEDAPPREGG